MNAPAAAPFIEDALLSGMGIAHGFGTRGASAPAGLARPRQVHGIVVAAARRGGAVAPAEADAVLSEDPGFPVGIVTADCLPILVATRSGRCVAAVHAGWRGLAAGVIGEAVARVRAARDEPVTAAIGPHVGACCYEVDEPVTSALTARFGGPVAAALTPTRPGHHRLDLAALAVVDLVRSGVVTDRIGRDAARCTACDADRFDSYRRDGERSGRMVHWVRARGDAQP